MCDASSGSATSNIIFVFHQNGVCVGALHINCSLGVTAVSEQGKKMGFSLLVTLLGQWTMYTIVNYHKNAQYMVWPFPYWFIIIGMFIIIMWGLFVSMTVCVYIYACVYMSNSGLSHCVSSAKIMLGLFVTSQ